MKSPLIRMKLLHVRSKVVLGFIGALLTAFFLSGVFSVSTPYAGASPVDTSLTELSPPRMPTVDYDDILSLLSLSLGGRDVAVAAWASMNPFERQKLRDQAMWIARLAQNAEHDGILSCPYVARTLRWGASVFLADAWENQILSEMDLSDEAVRSFYEANSQWYVNEEGTPISFEESQVRVRDDMIRAAILQRMERLSPR